MRMRIFISFGIFALLGCGCAPALPDTTASLHKAQQTLEEIERKAKLTSVEAAWHTKCTEDHYTATRRCFAYTFGGYPQAPFQVYYLNDQGPFILAGLHTRAIIDPTVRVDSQSVWVIPASPYAADRHIERARGLVADLRKGKTAYITYWDLYGQRRMEVDLAGFNEAYGRLLKERGKAKKDRLS